MYPLYGALSAECASVSYIWCSGRTSVYLCTSSLQNLAAGPLFPSGAILLTLYSMVWDWRVSSTVVQGQCFFIEISWSIHFLSSTVFLFLFFLSIGWYCGTVVFRLLGCKSLSPSLTLRTSFNNNNTIICSRHIQLGFPRWCEEMLMLNLTQFICRTLYIHIWSYLIWKTFKWYSTHNLFEGQWCTDIAWGARM